tara:strand:+ start:1950 stop:2825 length:876 start_codon:yes stop_codon:yes gene_type:complete
MFWSDKYNPKSLDEVTYNKDAAKFLKKIIKTKQFMHFVLYGTSGSGKRSLIRLFMKEVTSSDNVMWINQSCLKTIESREKLYTFIDSKSINGKKWLIVENLNKMVVNFSNILFNILSLEDIYVCILETESSGQVASWCMTINTYKHTYDELVATGVNILKKEKYKKINRNTVEECAKVSNNYIYTFLFLLQMKFEMNIELKEFSIPNISTDILLFDEDLRNRLQTLTSYELLGYSHLDISIYLYRYIYDISKYIEIAIVLGNTVEHLTKYEHDSYHLYGTICKIWDMQNNI